MNIKIVIRKREHQEVITFLAKFFFGSILYVLRLKAIVI